MSQTGARFAAAATDLVGVPFRLHGHDPAFGLDCVGVVIASLRAIGRDPVLARPYRLRTLSIEPFLELARQQGAQAATGATEAGDVLLVRPGPGQHHLLVAADAVHFVHAHAGLRRVTLTPAPLPWTPVRRWRLP